MARRSQKAFDPINVDIPRLMIALGIKDWQDRGGEIWAPCPYPGHDERTPSWSIRIDPDPRKNGYNHCFGCEREGGPVRLVMDLVQLSGFSAAIAWIKERSLDLDATPPLNARLVIRRPASALFQMPPGTTHEPLSQWNTVARRYIESRGITARQVDRWRLSVGRFGATRQRIVFPVYDRSGKLIDWTARAYAGQDRGIDPEPRYRHPDKSDGPDQTAVFGEEHWPSHPSKSTLVVCEGAINALACERAGAPCIGALSGSQFDKGQVLKISTFGNIILATDVDKAGSKIAAKLRGSLVRWSKVLRLHLPEGEDPADIAVRDLDELRERLEECVV